MKNDALSEYQDYKFNTYITYIQLISIPQWQHNVCYSRGITSKSIENFLHIIYYTF